MPKVTLLAEEYQTRMIVLGNKQYHFTGRSPLVVPTAVALHCKNLRGVKGEELFEVAGLDKVVANLPVKQNVEKESRLGFIQLRLIEAALCHS